jgi:hypothetical protein
MASFTAFLYSPALQPHSAHPSWSHYAGRMCFWSQEKIAVAKRWPGRSYENPQIEGHVPLHPALAEYLREWHDQTPYATARIFYFRP